jgi:uncharacterized protein YndB with AHSA1/START domain
MRESLAPDGSARVAISATPQRVFASLSDGDSVPTWMAAGNTVTSSRRGRLQPGDSIRITLRATLGMSPEPMIWEVMEVVPDKLVVLQLRSSSARSAMAIRRDSLADAGDSTIVLSRLTSTLPDSAKSSTTAEMMMSMFRMQSKLELETLKARIEGRAALPRR